MALQLPYHTVMQPVRMLSIVHAKLLQSPQEEEAFPGRFDHLVRVSRPGEVIADVHPEEAEAADLFHCGTVDV